MSDPGIDLDGLWDVPTVRTRVLDAAIAAYRRHAFHEVTLDVVAAEAGLLPAVVLAEFASWDHLVEATIDLWTTRRLKPIYPIVEEEGVVALLRAIVVSNMADPDLMRLLSGLVNVAATPEHPMSGVLQQKWLHFYALVQRALAHDIAIGREPHSIDVAHAVEQLIALYEGLQIQAMVRPSMHMLDSFDRAVALLRAGWSESQPVAVWHI